MQEYTVAIILVMSVWTYYSSYKWRMCISDGLGSARCSQGLQWVQVHPPGRQKNLGAEFMAVSCKCTSPRARLHPLRGEESYFLLVWRRVQHLIWGTVEPLILVFESM